MALTLFAYNFNYLSMSYPDTSHTLLKQALEGREDAWTRIIEQYGGFIYYFLQRNNVKENDREDLAQEILLQLTHVLKTYDREKGSFRKWLERIIRNLIYTHYRKLIASQNRDTKYLSERELQLQNATSELDFSINQEWEEYITHLAIENVKETFTGKAVEVFSLSLQGISTEEISSRTELSIQSVYTLRNRVKSKVQSEIRRLLKDLDE